MNTVEEIKRQSLTISATRHAHLPKEVKAATGVAGKRVYEGDEL